MIAVGTGDGRRRAFIRRPLFFYLDEAVDVRGER
jgi:hypothetical protein